MQRLEPVQVRDRRQRLPKALRNGTKADFQHFKESLAAGENFPRVESLLMTLLATFLAALMESFLTAFLTKTVCECHGELG